MGGWSEARWRRKRAAQTGLLAIAVESCPSTGGAAYIAEVYKIPMARMSESSDELANVRV